MFSALEMLNNRITQLEADREKHLQDAYNRTVFIIDEMKRLESELADLRANAETEYAPQDDELDDLTKARDILTASFRRGAV